jgi:hypothetical protein
MLPFIRQGSIEVALWEETGSGSTGGPSIIFNGRPVLGHTSSTACAGTARDCTDAGHDLALRQMPVAHQSPAAIIGQLVGMGC